MHKLLIFKYSSHNSSIEGVSTHKTHYFINKSINTIFFLKEKWQFFNVLGGLQIDFEGRKMQGAVNTVVCPESYQNNSLGDIKNLGVSWNSFFNAYIAQQADSRNQFSKVYLFVSKIVSTFINQLKTISISPIFVFDGLTNNFISYSHSYLQNIAIETAHSLSTQVVFSQTDCESKLALMLQSGEVDSVFADGNISAFGINSWITNINLETMEAAFSTSADIKPRNIEKNREEKIESMNNNAAECICAGIVFPPRIPRPKTGISNKYPLISLPRNTISYLNDISSIYFSIFKRFAGVDVAKDKMIEDIQETDEFLPLILSQNASNSAVELNETIFSSVLAQQNIVSRSFTSLFETMKSISSVSTVQKSSDDLPQRVITEAIRKFLTAHEYIAPGGGLSPWGRVLLNANTGNDIPTILFIEMIRAEAMDVDADTELTKNASVMDIIERIFSFFPSSTKPPQKTEKGMDTFNGILQVIVHSLNCLFNLIVADTYYSISQRPNIEEMKSIRERLNFISLRKYTTGSLMRFILESSDEDVDEFIDSVEDFETLKNEVKAAYKWWNDIQRATRELKQRSLKLNSRVSNLRNFLILFECADQFVQKKFTNIRDLFEI